ncbi:MAG TPA: FAD-binding and (Fe-S)-binding domain-containing protein [Acidimicrobiales bacterium]|nr:FAD-binding and (Fe-S)-binding domain-containing protein [Acidimicrobiales bacterium]
MNQRDKTAPPATIGTLSGTSPELLEALEHASPNRVKSRASDRLAYAHDASHYLLTPLVVVVPHDLTEVAALMAACAAHETSITFRSGGTSLSGQSTASGVLADTRRGFRGIHVLENGAKVRVEPGATVRQVNALLGKFGRKLGPDPASEIACTIGGVIANNSSGMVCGTKFNTYSTLESAVLVLPSGTTLNTADADAEERLQQREPELYDGLLKLRDRIRSNTDSVALITRLHEIKNTMGYGLNSFLDYDSPLATLLHLIVGSEGTLAFVAEATFRTVPVKGHLATGLLIFDNLADAMASLPSLVETGLAAIELLDATSLRVSQRAEGAEKVLPPFIVESHAALLIEFQEDSAEALRQQIVRSHDVLERLPTTFPAAVSGDAVSRSHLWRIRKGLYAAVSGSRPSGTTALLEDIAVPVASLLETCLQLVALFEKHGYDDSVIFGHAKDGNIHFMLNETFEQPAKLERYSRFTLDMVDLVLAQGGTLKAEHGTGRIMAPFIRRQYGDELFDVMREVKHLCDPHAVLNPGVLINEDPESHIRNLKSAPSVESVVDRCVECGYCEPVCPSKDLTLTPRQRIVLLREMARAQLAGDIVLLRTLETEFAHDGLDTCAADGMCQTACPVEIDTGDVVRILRSERHGSLERKAWEYSAKHWDGVSRAGGAALTVAKRLPAPLVTRSTRVLRSMVGADSAPLWDSYLPAGGSRRRSAVDVTAQVVHFPACIGTVFGATKSCGVSSAFSELCARAEITITVPEGIERLCCGTPWKSKGFNDGYAEMRQRTASVLWESSHHGEIPVVCDAASCTEGLETLLSDGRGGHPEIRVIDSVTFVDDVVLPRLTVTATFGSISLHPTCSSTRLGTNDALSRIAGAISPDVVVPEDWGCCAFAGDRGLLHPELTSSATDREAKEVATRHYDAFASTNRTCELGMTRATGNEYCHLLELLERATRPSQQQLLGPTRNED